MHETQETIYAWSEVSFPAKNGREAGIRAQAVKLLHEAVELALACGVSGSDVFDEVDGILDDVSEHQMVSGDATLEKAPAEVADVVIVANVLAGRLGCSLQSEVDQKMVRNRLRSWNVDASGKAQHVGGDGA